MSTLKRAKTVLSERRSWQLLVGRALTDPVWYFYLFWFPKFLASAHHLTMQQVAQTGWLVYLAAGVGTILGGMIASLWIKHGCAVAIAHRRVMIFSAILVPLSPLAGLNSSPALSVVIGAIVAMAHMSWLVNLTSLVIELFPPALVASAAGLIAAGSAVGGMVFSEVIGFVVTHYGYFPLFGIMACLHPLALAILWSSAKRLPQPAAAPMVAG